MSRKVARWNGLVKIFTDKGGDADKVAKAAGCSAYKLKKAPPKDADDFAGQMVNGEYEGPRGDSQWG